MLVSASDAEMALELQWVNMCRLQEYVETQVRLNLPVLITPMDAFHRFRLLAESVVYGYDLTPPAQVAV